MRKTAKGGGWRDNGERRKKEGDREKNAVRHSEPNRDSSVSVATEEKLTAGAFFLWNGGPGAGRRGPAAYFSAGPAPLWPCVCCGGEGAVNQQLARYRPAIEAEEGGPPFLSTSDTTPPRLPREALH